MTLKELYETLTTYVKHHPDDTVVVETNHGGIPTRVMIKLTKPMPGFDWTKGRFIFRTEEPIVPCKVLDRRPGDFARETLEKLKGWHQKLHGDGGRLGGYIPKAHEHSWIDGFTTGLRCHITSVEFGEEGTREKVLDAITETEE